MYNVKSFYMLIPFVSFISIFAKGEKTDKISKKFEKILPIHHTFGYDIKWLSTKTI